MRVGSFIKVGLAFLIPTVLLGGALAFAISYQVELEKQEQYAEEHNIEVGVVVDKEDSVVHSYRNTHECYRLTIRNMCEDGVLVDKLLIVTSFTYQDYEIGDVYPKKKADSIDLSKLEFDLTPHKSDLKGVKDTDGNMLFILNAESSK